MAIKDFFSVFARKKVDEIDRRILNKQKKDNARMRDAWQKAKDFQMNK